MALFATADVGRVSLPSEVCSEADDNEVLLDVERAQVSSLVANWRPYSVQCEDEGGLYTAHLVGMGADGSVPTGHYTSKGNFGAMERRRE